MRSKRSLEGYLLIDNREAPGLTCEEIAAQGLDPAKVAGAGVRGVFESATVTCAHCGAQVVLNPQRTRERGHCRRCDKYVCDKPGCNAGCLPLARVLDFGQTRAHRDPGNVLTAIEALRRDILG